MLSNIQMILICVGVSDETPLFRILGTYMNAILDSADRCPSRAEHVLGATRKWLALPPSPQCTEGAPGQQSLALSCLRLPRHP